MAQKLPVSNLVNVQLNLGAQPAQSQSLSNILILGISDVIDINERVRSYSSLSAVAADFGTVAPEYKAAVEWFSQSPQPKQTSIGRWANAATAAKLVGSTLSSAAQDISVWQAVTNGGFFIGIDGASAVEVTGLNLSANVSLNAVASSITAAITGATCVWNANYSRFEIKSLTTGVSSAVTFLTAPTSIGVQNLSTMLGLSQASSGSYIAEGFDGESAVQAVALFDESFGQSWYGLFVCTASDTDHLDIAEYIEGTNTKHMYGVNTQEAGVLVANNTTNIAYKLKQLEFKKTTTQFSSNSLYAVVSLLARILTTDYQANKSVITLMYKQEPGVVAERLNQTQVNALASFNCNVFVEYDNNTAIIQNGVVASGDYVDIITGADWLSIDIQNAVYNLLYTSTTKIPQTDDGNHLISSVITARLDQAVANGFLAPGVWQQGGFGILKQGDYLPTGYYVYVPDIDTQSQADRAARKSVPFQIAAKCSGAIHYVDILINLNQ